DYRSDQVFTQVMHEDNIDPVRISEIYNELKSAAKETLIKDGMSEADIWFQIQADMRYEGQSMEVRVSVPDGSISQASFAQLADRFHDNHERTFGYSYRGEQKVEVVNFAVSGFGSVDKPELPKLKSESSGAGGMEPIEQRDVYFSGQWENTPIYQRSDLQPATTWVGPLVIQEFGSTTVVFPGQQVDVDDYGILVVRNKD
ncbi:MAG: hypothetical protein ACR2OW_16095, partial [Methyloligellaceae bacterium]